MWYDRHVNWRANKPIHRASTDTLTSGASLKFARGKPAWEPGPQQLPLLAFNPSPFRPHTISLHTFRKYNQFAVTRDLARLIFLLTHTRATPSGSAAPPQDSMGTESRGARARVWRRLSCIDPYPPSFQPHLLCSRLTQRSAQHGCRGKSLHPPLPPSPSV